MACCSRTAATGNRIVLANEKNPAYGGNAVSNTKYNLITFLPLNLMEQFSRTMNRYFLIIAILQLFPVITPGGLAFRRGNSAEESCESSSMRHAHSRTPLGRVWSRRWHAWNDRCTVCLTRSSSTEAALGPGRYDRALIYCGAAREIVEARIPPGLQHCRRGVRGAPGGTWAS